MGATPFMWLLFLVSAITCITTVTWAETTALDIAPDAWSTPSAPAVDIAPDDWSTPSTPSASEVNCYVEVKTKVRLGGRCQQFGRIFGRASCQAGMHVQLGSPECQQSAFRSPSRRNRRTTNDSPTGASQNSNNVSDILSRLPQLSHADLLQYTPRAPSPENVNCYVEVPVTQRIGGRCVVLGNQMVGCQAGMYLAFSSECEGTTESSTNRRRSPSSPRTRTNRPNRSRP